MSFPSGISFTITNACNLRCRMCAQWSEEGYMRGEARPQGETLTLADWKRLVDEAAAHQVGCILLRGGEPFLFPGIMDLIRHIHHRGLFTAIDTNGTLLSRYAEELVAIGNIHLTFSVDGPEPIHEAVRGVPGCFARLKASIAHLRGWEEKRGTELSKAICFVISPYSLRGLGDMPDVARDLGIKTIAIVPYYYVPESVGQAYERVLREQWNCPAFSWRGFHHDTSGVDRDEFRLQYRRFMEKLGEITNYPYMPFSETDYDVWFRDAVTPVGPSVCRNVERWMDIQPDGSANFCVDFPDYVMGRVQASSLETLWNSERAERFRAARRARPLPVCHRCGARYMSGV